MSKKYILDLIVKENRPLSAQYFLLILGSDQPLPEMLPGQFVEARVDASPSTFLRRPLSIHYVDYTRNELWLLTQIVGNGTAKLSELQVGDTLNLILPLGNSFSLPENKDARLLLTGGGVGIAPMLFLGAFLRSKGYECDFLLGGRTRSHLVLQEEFERFGKIYSTTEDGSMGEKGYLTQHSVLKEKKYDKIYSCGPTPMMKAVADFARANQIDCEVSLENTMACGFGACLCCVTDTTDGHLCVCTEGPVFNITKLKW